MSTNVIFVNAVVGRGIHNNVVNLSFSTFNWTPTSDGTVIVDPEISARLRMDRVCFEQLRQAVNELADAIERSEAAAAAQPVENEETDGVMPREKTH